MTVAAWAQNSIQKLPAGAGAIGKGPDAIVLPGYEDVPRPPAFNDKVRAEVAEQSKFIDDYAPQPAWAGQTRAARVTRLLLPRRPRGSYSMNTTSVSP